MLLAPNIPAVYHPMLFIPNIALENAMACRVYRAVKLGFIKRTQSTQFDISVRSHSAPGEPGHELTFKQLTLTESRSLQVNVDITTTTDMEIHDDHATGKMASFVEEASDAYNRV